MLLAPLGQSYFIHGSGQEFFIASQASGTVLQFQPVLLDGPHTQAGAEARLLQLASRTGAVWVV